MVNRISNIQALFFSVIFALFCGGVYAQGTTVKANRVIADSVKIGSRWVYLIDADSSFASVSHRAVPTTKAVKDYLSAIVVGTNLTFTGSSVTFTLNSSTGTDVTFVRGTGINITRSSNSLTFSNTGIINNSLTNTGQVPFLTTAGSLSVSGDDQFRYVSNRLMMAASGSDNEGTVIIPGSSILTTPGTNIGGVHSGYYFSEGAGGWYGYDGTGISSSNRSMFIEAGTGNFTSKGKILIGTSSISNTASRTLHVTGEMRVTDLTTDTPTGIVGADADGDFGLITIGSGLSFSAGTLSATGGGGGGLTDGDYGDVTISGTGTIITIDNDAVTSNKIAADAVGSSEIATSAVTTTEILDGTIGTGDLAFTPVTGSIGSAGQILYSNGSNSAASESGLVWTAASDKLSIGNTSTIWDVTIDKDATDTGLGVVAHSATPTQRPVMAFARTRGTLASPTTVASGDLIGSFTANGYDGSGYQTTGRIDFRVDGSVSAGVVPMAYDFVTGTTEANRTARLTISSSGPVGVGVSSSIPARFAVRGSGTSTASTFIAENSAGTDILELRDNLTAGFAATPLTTAFVTIAAPTTSKAQLNLIEGTAPTSPVDGDIYYASNELTAKIGGLTQVLSTTMYRGSSTSTLVNSSTETSITPSGAGTLTIPANYLVAGKTIRVKFAGNYSTDGTVPPDLNLKLKLGSTVVAEMGDTELALAASGQFNGELTIQCYTTGAAGTVFGSGLIVLNYGISGDKQVWLSNATTTVTLDTTTSQTIALAAQWSNADTDNSITVRSFTVEIL